MPRYSDERNDDLYDELEDFIKEYGLATVLEVLADVVGDNQDN